MPLPEPPRAGIKRKRGRSAPMNGARKSPA
jgi:hypothetical protein